MMHFARRWRLMRGLCGLVVNVREASRNDRRPLQLPGATKRMAKQPSPFLQRLLLSKMTLSELEKASSWPCSSNQEQPTKPKLTLQYLSGLSFARTSSLQSA